MICVDAGSIYYYWWSSSSNSMRKSITRSRNTMMTMVIHLLWDTTDTDTVRAMASIGRRESKRIK